MKISNPTTFAFVCFLVQAAAVSAKKGFTSPPEHGPDFATMERIKTAANFDAQGVRMEICPTGDCLNGKYMRLSVASLTELDVNGSAVESVDKFKPKNSDWTDIKTTEVGGVNISSTTFVSTVEVGAGKKSKTFAVSAGALKFTVDIAGWPFSTTANNLVLAVSLDAKGANNKALGTPQMKPKVEYV
ncbi:uncharacterized protein KRP23_9457 [Phytophthora ramorum]|uniref:uncharacterized protein n=1 Tax=Phytophthora ramorum TaxID=164328 RepID=UPI0030AA1A85|nr:hypothetical protein KRP23_9457 [Phytophthora ramorum]